MLLPVDATRDQTQTLVASSASQKLSERVTEMLEAMTNLTGLLKELLHPANMGKPLE